MAKDEKVEEKKPVGTRVITLPSSGHVFTKGQWGATATGTYSTSPFTVRVIDEDDYKKGMDRAQTKLRESRGVAKRSKE